MLIINCRLCYNNLMATLWQQKISKPREQFAEFVREEMEANMKFKDMPYERVDFDKVDEEFKQLMAEFDAAKSGEEQFEVHKKYYDLTDRVSTMMTIANIDRKSVV